MSCRPSDAPTDDVCREDEQSAGQVDDDGQDRLAGRLAPGRSSQRRTQAGTQHQEEEQETPSLSLLPLLATWQESTFQVSRLLSAREETQTESNLETTWEILSWQEQKSDSEIT